MLRDKLLVAYISLTPMPKIGGEWTFLLQMTKGLETRGHGVAVVSPEQMPAGWMTLANRSAQLIRLLVGSWVWFFFRMAFIGFLLRRLASANRLWERADVFDTQDPISFLASYGPARRRGHRVILTIHGYFHYESNMGSIRPESFWGGLLKRIERHAYATAPRIVTVDSRLKEYVVRLGAAPEKVHVRSNFVDSAVFVPVDAARKAVERRRLGVSGTSKIVCCARRLEEKCGVRYAVEAIRVLVGRGCDVTLLIAGTGSLEADLRNLAEELEIPGHVRFLGHVAHEEMANVLSASDAAVVPSVTVGEEVEATSFAALEAMASGLPVVASDLGGLRELITQRVTGILVLERSPDAIADGLERAFSAEGVAIGQRARQVIESRFSLDAGVEDTLSIYHAPMPGLTRGHAP